jgi:iron complex outermembrane recepter protein
MFKFSLLIFMAFSPLFGFSQSPVKGVVIDSLSGKSLPGATILLQPSGKVTITDQFGEFRINKVNETQSVTVTYVGYKSKTLTSSSGTDLQILLQPSSQLTETVVVTATRSSSESPVTSVTLSKEAIQKQNFGQDVPYLINWTPSVVTTSDAGTGIGYSGIRIRGSDATRVNVTINGVPYNDSESLGTFWVDIPDIASSSQSIQIQRGVGTSTNGAGAFGGTINLLTNVRNDNPYAEVVNSLGSFKTRRHTFSFGSGLLHDHWLLEGRVSRIASDGYIDRGSADLSSYYFSGGFYSGKTLIKAVMFGGKERTFQAWYGVPQSRLSNDIEAMGTTAANEGWNEEQTENLLRSNARTFNPYLYKNQVDDYRQDHFQLHFSQAVNEALTWNTALHYTPGKGYYEEYKYDADLADYGIAYPLIGDSLVTNTDLVRRRWLKNDFYGLTWSLNYQGQRTELIWGGAWNRYDGDHFGEITWAEVAPVRPEHRYYLNNGDKRDFNSFVKVNYQATEQLALYGDLQYRGITYTASGLENDQSKVDIDAQFNFFNPKVGTTYTLSSKEQAYASFAVANREPVRDDYLSSADAPEHETLQNLEAGYRRVTKTHTLNVNYYLMQYKNQLVLTGELNDVGAPVRANAGRSYRMGIETEAGLRLSGKVLWNVNLTLSRNRIESYSELLEDYGDNFDEYSIVRNTYDDTDISFSPSVVGGSQLSWQPATGLEISLLTKYVGKQYLDNTRNEARIIDPYLVNDVRMRYVFQPKFLREVAVSFLVNNILNEEYESNGYTWGYLAGSTAYRENYYYPQAGINFMFMLGMKF